MQRWGYQNRIRYQTVSYEAEEMWSPVVHTLKHGAQDLKWVEWKNNVHARSGTQQCSAEFTTRHHFKSLCVVSLTSNINITKIYSSSCLCSDWTDSTGLPLPVKQVKKYAEPMDENNAHLTDRFPLLCNNYFIKTLLESTGYLLDHAI